MQQATRQAAEASPTTHRFVPDLGYVELGEPTIENPDYAARPVVPPAPAAKDSVHVLAAMGKEIEMRWKGDLWVHPLSAAQGNRLGWSPAFLARAGWRYVRAA